MNLIELLSKNLFSTLVESQIICLFVSLFVMVILFVRI